MTVELRQAMTVSSTARPSRALRRMLP